jgi:hypothetical protein
MANFCCRSSRVGMMAIEIEDEDLVRLIRQISDITGDTDEEAVGRVAREALQRHRIANRSQTQQTDDEERA